ncbi:MAG: ABC transporter substrate-binding protein [archaeon YNP-WB-062]|nr:ABC transporter substrate-binding protein [Candidatus Culexarchaeum yellowstonense]
MRSYEKEDEEMKKVYWSMSLIVILLLIFDGTGRAVTLRFWTGHGSPDIDKWFDEVLIPQFEQAHPGVKVERLRVPWGELNEKIMTAFAAGTAPDIVFSGTEQIIDEAIKGLARPLNDYIKKWGEYKNFIPMAWKHETIGGKIYRVPIHISSRALMYNKTIFKQAGINPNTIPEKWEQIAELGKKLNLRDDKGNLIRLGADLWYTHQFCQGFYYFLYQNKGKIIADDFSKSLFNSEAGVETLQYFVNLFNELTPPNLPALPSGPIPNFAAGKIAIYVNTPQGISDLEKYAPKEFEFGIAFPFRKSRIIQLYVNGIYITTQSKNPDLAWEFIKFFASSDNLREFNNTYFTINPRKFGAKIDDPFIKQRPLLVAFYEQAQKIGIPYPIIPNYGTLQNRILKDAIDAALYKKMTPKQALEDAAKKWDASLEELRKEGVFEKILGTK